MTQERSRDLVSAFSSRTVLVIGDYFLDKYLMIDRALDEPSLETGLTAYQVVETRLYPGAAGTVTNNLTALGAHVIALGVIGEDGEGYDLLRRLKATGVDTSHMIVTPERFTPTYTKPMFMTGGDVAESNRQDIRNRTATPAHLEAQLLSRLAALAPLVDAVVALDQVVEAGTGCVTEAVRGALCGISHTGVCPVVYADSRAFSGAFTDVIVKCNHLEAVAAADPGGDTGGENIARCAQKLAARNHRPVFVTHGAAGMIVAEGDSCVNVPAFAVEGPLDICGAGDAATSGIVMALCCGATPGEAALVGNAVASVTIRQLGVTGTSSPDELLAALSNAHTL